MTNKRLPVQRRVNRRTVVSGAVATGATAALWKPAAGEGTPDATAVSTIDTARLMALSERLAGGASLNEDAAEGLLTLLEAEPGFNSAFEELESLGEITDEAVAGTTDDAQRLSTNILQYWFLGRYDGEPVENRADFYFSFASWQALPYSTQQSTCKSFGYWALEIEL